MKFFLCISLILPLICGSATALAETTTGWSGAGKISFSGTSTLHSWSGKVPADPFTAQVIMADTGTPKTLSATVTVKAKDMNTAEPERDEKMRSSMKVTSYPLITGSFVNVPFASIMPDGRTPAQLPFKLEIMGKKQDVQGTISNWKLKGNTATFDLDFELSLKKCGISVPSVLLVVRVGDAIKVRATVTLVRASA